MVDQAASHPPPYRASSSQKIISIKPSKPPSGGVPVEKIRKRREREREGEGEGEGGRGRGRESVVTSVFLRPYRTSNPVLHERTP